MKFSKYFDHTLLKSNATRADIDKLCEEAIKYDFYSVCVNPMWVYTAHENLRGSDVKVTSVVGFPFGAMTSSVMEREAFQALCDGADEIDMVANPGLLLSGTEAELNQYIAKIQVLCDCVHNYPYDKLLKVILETELLNEAQIRHACQICRDIGVDYVKTSSGFAPCEKPGADCRSVLIMKEESEGLYKIKASGGIRTLKDAEYFVSIGADRLGCSASVSIMDEYNKKMN